MPYITTSNAKSIVRKIETKNLNIHGEVYKIPIYFFNKLEKNQLLLMKELFSNPNNFFQEYYKPIKVQDNYNYVFEGKPPSYHQSPDCDRLKSNYENFELPEAIKERGPREVEKFRKWFKEHQYLLDKPDIFAFRLYTDWDVTTNMNNIVMENSGHASFQNFTVQELEEEIDFFIKKAGQMYRQNTSILKQFNKHAYLGKKLASIKDNNTGFSNAKVKQVLIEFEDSIKIPLKAALTNYYRVKLNPELNLNDRILEQLGFKPCASCYKFNTELSIPNRTSFKPKSTVSYSIPSTVTGTYSETLKYIQKGHSVSTIANRRGVSASTIVNHINKLQESVDLTTYSNIRPSQRTIDNVQRAINSTGETQKLKPIFEYLNEQVSYNDIRLSLLFINRNYIFN